MGKKDIERGHQVRAVRRGVAGSGGDLAQKARRAHVNGERRQVIAYDAVRERHAKRRGRRVLLREFGRVDRGAGNHIARRKEVEHARSGIRYFSQWRRVVAGNVIAALWIHIGELQRAQDAREVQDGLAQMATRQQSGRYRLRALPDQSK